MSDLSKFLEEIEERLARATPGPWESDSVSEVTCADGDVYFNMTLLNAENNANLIAHAPTDLAKLIKILKVYDRELERIGELKLETLHGPTIYEVVQSAKSKALEIAGGKDE